LFFPFVCFRFIAPNLKGTRECNVYEVSLVAPMLLLWDVVSDSWLSVAVHVYVCVDFIYIFFTISTIIYGTGACGNCINDVF